LGAFGLTHRQITRLVEELGHNAKALLQDNPYELCRLLPGLGFIRVDEMAQKLGVVKEHPARMAAVLGTLVVAVRELARAIAPIIPDSAERLLSLIDAGEAGTPIAQPAPPFPRLELEAEEAA
jgi:hypothetical protein